MFNPNTYKLQSNCSKIFSNSFFAFDLSGSAEAYLTNLVPMTRAGERYLGEKINVYNHDYSNTFRPLQNPDRFQFTNKFTFDLCFFS